MYMILPCILDRRTLRQTVDPVSDNIMTSLISGVCPYSGLARKSLHIFALSSLTELLS